MAKRPELPTVEQIEMFPPATLGQAPPKPKRMRIRPVPRDRLSDWFQRKDLLPNGEGRIIPLTFDDEGDAG
jgi:hypothetical protein